MSGEIRTAGDDHDGRGLGQPLRRATAVKRYDIRLGHFALSDLGEDKVIWASDYPHPDSTWPHSHKYIDEHMTSLTPTVRKKLTCDNTVRLYNL